MIKSRRAGRGRSTKTQKNQVKPLPDSIPKYNDEMDDYLKGLIAELDRKELHATLMQIEKWDRQIRVALSLPLAGAPAENAKFDITGSETARGFHIQMAKWRRDDINKIIGQLGGLVGSTLNHFIRDAIMHYRCDCNKNIEAAQAAGIQPHEVFRLTGTQNAKGN